MPLPVLPLLEEKLWSLLLENKVLRDLLVPQDHKGLVDTLDRKDLREIKAFQDTKEHVV
jgi:hypothetical protein